MLASTRPNQGKRGRRGIVLVLILGVLALMAVIGVAFATFSGQSRISARNFAQSVNQPQRDELMDYALEQLIGDTADIRSSIRGHSMARDMYGNDGNFNGYLASRPDGAFMPPHGDPYFYITGVTAGTGTLYNLTTNIPANDPAFYGYNFTRWTLRVSYNGTLANGGTGVVAQTLEVLADTSPSGYRVFTVNIATTDAATTLINPTVTTSFPTGYVTQLPGQYLTAAASGTLTGVCQFILDGRWLHAFNGPGITTNAVHANFRYNGLSPNTTGMDEDYDAVDLENWFLAMQSADGSVMIPSFHRPAAIRIDTANGYYDWGGPTNTTPAWADSASRILRPRQADGHDSATFPDLVPGPNGRITYDVDNDGDGQTDSVWVDLGYPARRNAQGQLYKPLFAFMVIGLNGRIPLNTAGNLAGGGPGNGGTHAAHLGNSVSEIDPTYGLQNGFDPTTNDITAAFSTPVYNPTTHTITYTDANGNVGLNGQVDSAGVDVRLTQLRNLLVGTRPQGNPTPTTTPTAGFPQTSTAYPMITDPAGAVNGDDNFVPYNYGHVYFMPSGTADPTADVLANTSPNQVIRITPPVAGRWGEAQSVPGNPVPPPAGTTLPDGSILNLVGRANQPFNNRIRAGYSEDITDVLNDIPRDAADDNLNSFDPYPPITVGSRVGEVGDLDFLDPAGAFLLPVERLRRYVAPGDINGTGRILQWDGVNQKTGPNAGGDQWGRVEYSSYFRPPGLPGLITPTPPGSSGPFTTPVTFPWTSTEAYPTTMVTNVASTPAATPPSNSNPLHGFEAQRFPNLNYPPVTPNSFNPQRAGGVPIDLNANPNLSYLPGTFPTYDASANGKVNSDGLNEADEMNLYVPNAQLDTPFGYGDLEWLYRQQDVDGGSLVSRLAQLAPVSFTNTIDGQRRRRLFALDSWEMNNLAWTNDNPGGLAFTYNARFTPNSDAGFTTLNVPAATNTNIAGLPNPTNAAPSPTPSLAQRDKKINLNYPLPVSNDPNEAVRQKWISDTYQTLKAILPPRSVDTAEELAQLSQYVINIIDFRDTDATMTHWQNPDVYLRTSMAGASPFPVLAAAYSSTTDVPLDQYGMEYNPIAINEVMAYSFASTPTTNRFFIELVNTLTSPELGTPTAAGMGLAPNTGTNNASVLDLAGFQSSGAATPWDGGCWDLVFTDDLPQSRPDPVLGQLQPGGNYYGLLPLASGATGSISSTYANPLTPPGDPVLFPLPQAMPPGGIATAATAAALAVLYQGYFSTPTTPPWTNNPLAPYYFTTIGNPMPSGAESTPFTPTYTLNAQWDPVNSGTPPGALPPGVLPPPTYGGTPPAVYPGKILNGIGPGVGSGNGAMFWVCLRRPANPFAGVSATNPMIVVDAMRFPFIESGGKPGSPPTIGKNYIFSYQRLQPFRGGHAVPMPGVSGALDPRYGYSEQVAVPTTTVANYGQSGGQQITGPATPGYFYHTLGLPNDAGGVAGGAYPGVAGVPPTGPPYTTPPVPPYLNEPWDYFPFNDRDFTSVAELLMVPGCPPGLFTKQFAEFAPSSTNVTSIFSQVSPLPSALTSTQLQKLPVAPSTASNTFNAVPPTFPLTPHTFPYLVDKFFYTGASPTTATTSLFGDPTGDGWFKMFEFFEVPSQMIGAIGPVAQGTNFDWLRQDTKPGLINLNLIIDEEVFFSVFGSQNTSFNQQLLSFDQLPNMLFPNGLNGQYWTSTTTPLPVPLAAGTSPLPLVVTATLASGAPAAAYAMNNVGVVAYDRLTNTIDHRMKASFAQFLSLRHGGSDFVFGYGSGAVGQNFAVATSPANPNAPATPNLIPADRPFHSLSYPDINYTIMRPAALPPSAYTDPLMPTTPPTPAWPPTGYTGGYIGDPGVRNPSLYQGFATNASATPPGSNPASILASQLLVPPAIPVRRLFQPPDYSPPITTTPPLPITSNASEQGDPYINNLIPATAPVATGGLPQFLGGGAGGVGGTATYNVNDSVVNLFWVPSGTAPQQPPVTTPPTPLTNPYLGVNSNLAATPSVIDTKQHPYFRTEMLQKAMNLTTVRTHQYAVWITVGFFEVTRQGDLLMAGANAGTPAAALAFDILGPEIGASTGQTTRFRGFFLVDRLQLTGYDPNVIGSFRPAVVYRQTIE